MAKLLECRCHGGRLMISSMALHQLQQYPEAHALLAAIYAYLSGFSELPAQEMSVKEINVMVK